MKAVVFKEIGVVELVDVPKPEVVQPCDAIVRITKSAICGSDLHVLHGRIPGMEEGGIMGHEFSGIVESCGKEVTEVSVGQTVVGSFTVPCGSCWYCSKRQYNRCPDQMVYGYGTFFGSLDGAQTEYVRVPNANLALHPVDSNQDEGLLFLGDIFTTGYDAAVEGNIHEGDIVTVQGCGPVGLMAIQCARTFKPSIIYGIDSIQSRLDTAQSFGAVPVNTKRVHAPTYIQDMTGGRGADIVIECVGAIPAMLQALDLVRPGGRVSVIGVYSEPEIELPLNVTFIKGIDIKFCGTANIIGRWDQALQLVQKGEVTPSALISHRLPLEQALKGYELFDSKEALKVVLTVGNSQ